MCTGKSLSNFPSTFEQHKYHVCVCVKLKSHDVIKHGEVNDSSMELAIKCHCGQCGGGIILLQLRFGVVDMCVQYTHWSSQCTAGAALCHGSFPHAGPAVHQRAPVCSEVFGVWTRTSGTGRCTRSCQSHGTHKFWRNCRRPVIETRKGKLPCINSLTPQPYHPLYTVYHCYNNYNLGQCNGNIISLWIWLPVM